MNYLNLIFLCIRNLKFVKYIRWKWQRRKKKYYAIIFREQRKKAIYNNIKKETQVKNQLKIKIKKKGLKMKEEGDRGVGGGADGVS